MCHLLEVDQVNRSVDAIIISFVASPSGDVNEGQQIQPAGRNVFSSCDCDSIDLYAEGPCCGSELSLES